jgi:hypothetical protein
MKYLCFLILPFLLIGCDQYFRYPCQDPEKWDTAQCKKPICEVNRDCPEYIFNTEGK